MKTSHKILMITGVAAIGLWLAYERWLTPPAVRQFADPVPTQWRPEGPRVPGFSDYSIIPRPTAFRTMHADIQESDEVWIATAPTFEVDWVAEPEMFIPEGPTFDNAGNVYFSPLNPKEDVSLVVLDSATGKRRWTLPGRGQGAGAPLILNDPERPGQQIVYHATYERFWAVRPDGTVIWEAATGLSEPPPVAGQIQPTHQWGVKYLPQRDAVMGVTMDARLFAHDRRTGEPVAVPFRLPGHPTNPATHGLPDIAMKWGNEESFQAFGLSGGGLTHFEGVLNIIYGGMAQISNAYAVDPHTGRVYICATADDASDGKKDGLSENGAIYAVELLESDNAYRYEVTGQYTFTGGSGSTPALTQDGKRLMVSDEQGHVIAIDTTTMREDWRVNVGEQIAASIAVSSDNSERYAVTRTDVFKLIDHGDRGEIVWKANFNAYPDSENFNALTATITANGILVSQGAGIKIGDAQLMAKVGVGLLDRETGELRYFAEGREDSISVSTIGPDGAPYTAGSPIRRMVAKGLYGNRLPPIIGGITRYKPGNKTLLAREALCAAAHRADNAARFESSHPASAATDREQIRVLLNQALANSSGNQGAAIGALLKDESRASLKSFSAQLGALCAVAQ